jgi:hypothetical protein
MKTVPADTPVTTPVEAPTVAIVLLLLLHVPPDTVLEREDVLPIQITAVPEIVPAVPA